ncbi:MAG TPA: ABC transporter permease subunit [Candidatus Angelobacter sp.]|nr:ABC transporter permease subunit [Candidatus Angelobacter sp.]
MAIMLVAGMLGATLIRLAPGFSADEQELNSKLSASSILALRQARTADSNILAFYGKYLSSLVRGDLGASRSLGEPVKELIRERLPITLQGLCIALALAWLTALALAVAIEFSHSQLLAFGAEGLSGAFLSTPAAVLALLFVLLRWPPELAAALLVFPRIYRYCSSLLHQSRDLPYVLVARAKGAGPWRVLLWHTLPAFLPQLLALLGVSFSIVLGVLLPIEVICDVPGIGQLAWQAAEARDLPLLVNLTLLVTFMTVFATMLSDIARGAFTRATA